MITEQLQQQVRADLKSLKDVQDKFLRTYKQVVVQCGGPEWQKVHSETLLHHVRKSIIPIMEQEGMDAKAIQALCSWAERQVMTK